MKKIKLLLLLLMLGSLSAYSQIQQIKIVSFTVKNQLPSVIDNWNNVPGSLLLVAQLPPTIRVKGIKLIVQIKAGGAIVCSNNSTGGMQVDEFTTRTFSANELTGALQGCHDLKDGSYSICVQFYNVDRVAISNEVCKEFSVETPKPTDFAPPTLITPENGKGFTEAELQRPVMFRWTPLVPKPKEPITYRLRVWQLMQGQNGQQAMRSNQPTISKDVDNITQAVVSGILTGPCKPPYLCDFIWNVQGLNREGKPMGRNEGTSEPYTFTVKNSGDVPTGNIKPPVNVFPENNKSISLDEAKNTITFKWKPVVPNQSGIKYKLRVWQLMQGQTGLQAIKTNQPLAMLDVDGNGSIDALTDGILRSIITGPCKPPYLCDFIWNVEAIMANASGQPGKTLTSEPTIFSVKNNGEVLTGSIHPPVNIFPENNKKFTLDQAKGAVTFKWKSVDPKQNESITYRLRVWQLMQGQSPQTAMKSNQPIVSKEVNNNTEAIVTGVITGPCRPPYMCDFVWDVQALNKEGHPVGSNEGTSEPTTFKIQNNIDIQIDSVKVGCCEKGKQSIYINVKNNLASSVNIVAVKYKINGVGAAINLTPISPSLPQLVVGNGFVVFTSNIECNPNINFLKFLVDAEDVADADNKETEVKSDTLNCICNACKDIKIQPNDKDKPAITQTGITQNISFVTGPGKVKSVKMDLVWFEFVPESDDCLVCTTPSSQMGNFSSGTLNGVGGSGGGTHGLIWNFSPPKDMNGGVALQYSISYPKMVACCGAKARWCIRYTVTYENCVTCSVVVCNYEAAIKGCNK